MVCENTQIYNRRKGCGRRFAPSDALSPFVLQGMVQSLLTNGLCSSYLPLKLRALIVSVLLASVPAHAHSADWWQTPEQQAQSALEAGDIEKLRQLAPNTQWQGVAEHTGGEFETAAELFSQAALQAQLEGRAIEANRALYNQGVSEVQAGQYEQAVNTFDQVLEKDPQFADAKHNRDIAQQLVQQEQEEQQQEQSGDGNESSDEQGENQESAQDGEPSESQQNSDQGESEEQQNSEQSDANDGESGDDDEQQQSPSEAQQAQDEQAARDALEAQAQAGELNDDDGEPETQEEGAMPTQQPLSESEQATEQWLRRIPDDPAGLLRRKLEQSHRSEYPEVRDARQPW